MKENISPPLDKQKSKTSKIYQREMKSNDTKRNLKILTRKLKKMIPIERKNIEMISIKNCENDTNYKYIYK